MLALELSAEKWPFRRRGGWVVRPLRPLGYGPEYFNISCLRVID